MASPFFDTFLPQAASSAAGGGSGALQGKNEGQFLLEELQRSKLGTELLKWQMEMAKRPQPIHYPQGTAFGMFDPMKGSLTMQGQVPLQPHPLAPEAAEKDMAQAAEARAKAKAWESGTGPAATTDQRNAAALNMPFKDYMDYKKGLVEGAKLSKEDLNFMADQALAGDTSVFQNLGRGLQGAENVVALRGAIREKARQRNMGGSDMAASVAEFMGIKAGERTLGTRTANIGMAVSEAQMMAPLALTASAKVDRSQFPTLNKLLLAAERGTGGEDVVRLGIAVNSLINIYARAINPTGVPTVSDKEHARELLAGAWSHGQFQAGIDQLMLELGAASKAPGIVRKEFRGAVTGEEKPKPYRPKSSSAPAVGTIKDGYRFKGGDPSKQENWEAQ